MIIKRFHKNFIEISKRFHRCFIQISYRFHKDVLKIPKRFYRTFYKISQRLDKYFIDTSKKFQWKSKIVKSMVKYYKISKIPPKNKNNKDPVRISSFTRDQKLIQLLDRVIQGTIGVIQWASGVILVSTGVVQWVGGSPLCIAMSMNIVSDSYWVNY